MLFTEPGGICTFILSSSSLWALGHMVGAPAVSFSFLDSLWVWEVVSFASTRSRLERGMKKQLLCGEQMVNGALPSPHPGQATVM